MVDEVNSTVLPSSFNPETFLDQTVEAPFETHRTTVPAKDGYLGVISDLGTQVITTKQGQQRAVLRLFWEILDDELKNQLNLPKVIVRQDLFLDLNEKGLAWGVNQNVNLGQVRDAVGQNTGSAWAPRMLKGAGPCRLKVSESIDERNVSIKYNNVDRVSRLS